MTQWWAPTVVRVSGDSTMRGQLLKTTDGGLLCNFPERMVLIANHQIYTDWLYLWWIGYAAGMHGRIYVVLKESLKRIPVIGWGMQFAQFIFLKRKWEDDKPRLSAHMQKFNNLSDPMWLMLFPEGTNLADSTRETSKQWAAKNGIHDMRHTLIPRSTGLQFMLQELRTTVDYLYDCTIAYEGVSRGQYAQDIFTVGASYFGGRPPKSVNMYWRRFRISAIPLDDPVQFELWLRSRWLEKDKFIETYHRTGRFPADTGSNKDFKGQIVHGSGHIEAAIRPKYWYEFLQVFAPIGLFALVLYVFYGALPQQMVDKIKSIDQKSVLKQIDAIQKGQLKVPETKDIMATAPKSLQEQFGAMKKFAATHDTTTGNIIARSQQALPVRDSVQTSGASVPNLSKARLATPASSAPQAPSGSQGSVANSPAKSKSLKTGTSTKQASSTAASAKAQAKKAPSSGLKPTQLIKAPKKSKLNSASNKSDVRNSTMGTKSAPNPTVPKSSNVAASKAPPKKIEVKAQKSAADPGRTTTNTSAGVPTEKAVDSADIRKARKKLELRQGKQEPKRKTRRALEASAK